MNCIGIVAVCRPKTIYRFGSEPILFDHPFEQAVGIGKQFFGFCTENWILQYLRVTTGHFPSDEEWSPIDVSGDGGQVDVLPDLCAFLFGRYGLIFLPVKILLGGYRLGVGDQIFLVLIGKLLAQGFIFGAGATQKFFFLFLVE